MIVQDQEKIDYFIDTWLKKKINFTLKNLIDLKYTKETNSSIKAYLIDCMKIMCLKKR